MGRFLLRYAAGPVVVVAGVWAISAAIHYSHEPSVKMWVNGGAYRADMKYAYEIECVGQSDPYDVHFVYVRHFSDYHGNRPATAPTMKSLASDGTYRNHKITFTTPDGRNVMKHGTLLFCDLDGKLFRRPLSDRDRVFFTGYKQTYEEVERWLSEHPVSESIND